MDLGCVYRCGVQGMHSLTSLGMFSVHTGVFESFVPTSTCAWACGQGTTFMPRAWINANVNVNSWAPYPAAFRGRTIWMQMVRKRKGGSLGLYWWPRIWGWPDMGLQLDAGTF